MKLIAWGKSDTGRARDHNEDNYLVDMRLGLFAVADGMGGHQGGETASRIVIESLREQIEVAFDDFAGALEKSVFEEKLHTQPMSVRAFRQTEEIPVVAAGIASSGDGAGSAGDAGVTSGDEPTAEIVFNRPAAAGVVQLAATRAGRAVFDAALSDAGLHGMGTTLTAMLAHGGRMHVAHAGDSRAFLFRDNRIEQLTEDHSWIWEQVKSGAMTEEEAKESKFRHIITRSVGFEREVEVDIIGVTIRAGDCFLLCSDGLSNYVSGDELARILETTWYRRAPQLLIDLANERGGDDNITVVVVYACNDAENGSDGAGAGDAADAGAADVVVAVAEAGAADVVVAVVEDGANVLAATKDSADVDCGAESDDDSPVSTDGASTEGAGEA